MLTKKFFSMEDNNHDARMDFAFKIENVLNKHFSCYEAINSIEGLETAMYEFLWDLVTYFFPEGTE